MGLILRILFLGDSNFFHLATHALFKSLPFIFYMRWLYYSCLHKLSGYLIYSELSNNMPLVSSYFNICRLSLCGFLFPSGFYSKDIVIEMLRIRFSRSFIYFIYIRLSSVLIGCHRQWESRGVAPSSRSDYHLSFLWMEFLSLAFFKLYFSLQPYTIVAITYSENVFLLLKKHIIYYLKNFFFISKVKIKLLITSNMIQRREIQIIFWFVSNII